MATAANPPPGAFALQNHDGSDPFVTSAPEAQRQRYAAFDNSQFSLYLNGSPGQAKRALQAHLTETQRRLEETSHLGKSLVRQRQELEEKLKEVEKQQEDTDIGPELRQRLAELEKEFNDVGRETARAFLPKSRVPSGENDSAAGASVYSSEALHSPSKVSVPSRKQRNAQPSRINDIALATEISTSLLSQLKELQAVLLEKDEALKSANLDRSQLEIEVEGLSQRLRTIDESENRLKDVNWNLETQVREFEATSKAAADKEHRMNHNLNLVRTEKASLEREFEELKQLYAKLTDDHSSKTKVHETELSGLRRNVSMGETERGALQRKVEELATQNQELAKAMAYRMRAEDQQSADDSSANDDAEEGNTITPEHSPPPSPSKATPRHGLLESETLKHSLHHAHRMIQQLKNNIHREKTEKIELKRMLQDTRDEMESNRLSNGSGSASKRRKNDKDVFKKPARPDRLGALRTGSQEVTMDDEEWEEQEGQITPSKRSKNVDTVPGAFPGGFSSAAESGTDANETSDAFETANERDGTTTETDAFQTGAETLDGDSSDELTETEGGPTTDTIRGQKPAPLALAGSSKAYESTASTSGDEDETLELKTPIQSQHPRFRMRKGYRRSTPRSSQDLFASTPPLPKDSPASFASNNSTPAQGQSLFAELGALSGSEDGSVADGTPSRSSLLSPESSPEVNRKSVVGKSPLQSVSLPKPIMVDSGMMTEVWVPESSKNLGLSSLSAHATEPVAALQPSLDISTLSTQGTEPKSAPQQPLHMSSLFTQGTEPKSAPQQPLHMSTLFTQGTEPKAAPPQALHMSSLLTQGTEPKAAPPQPLHLSSFSAQDTEPRSPVQQPLNMSTFSTQDTVPQSPAAPSLHMSSVSGHGTDPISPVIEKIVPPSLNMSSIAHQTTEPREGETSRTPLLVSSIAAQATEPSDPSRPTSVLHVPSAVSSQETESRELPTQIPLQVSSFSTQATEPIEAPKALPPQISSLSYQATEPVEAPRATPSQISSLSYQATEPVEAPKAAPSQISSLSYQATEPVEAPKPVLSQYSAVSSQATEPVEAARPAPPQLSQHSFQATEPVEPPKPARLQLSVPSYQATDPVEPLQLPLSKTSTVAVQQTSPVDPVVQIPQHRVSDVMVLQDTQPESPTLPAFLPGPSRPSTATRAPQLALSLSGISAQETEPFVASRPVTAQRTGPVASYTSSSGVQTENEGKSEEAKLGFFSSVLPWSKGSSANAAESESQANISRDGRVPLGAISSNAVQTSRNSSPSKAPRSPTVDYGTQTMVSADQIDKLLAARSAQRHSGTIAAAGIEKSMSPPSSPRRLSNDPNKIPRRPGSSSSIRSRAADAPPLPPNHKDVIAAAALKSRPMSAGSGAPPTTPGSMGPPGIPASAYKKRPQTPSIKTKDLGTTPKTGGTTPRPRQQAPRSDYARSGASSPVTAITRRSSVSSFASEIDHRFDPSLNPFANSGFDPSTTDPRMIQAITQTMIGEFMWKYTRKAGSGATSEKRHRRFFWVHPYNRTLYWSDQDPAAAGRAQLKAKSVALEAVHVVTDDNPYPPGLHRKSIVVTTPGRTIKFTATTGQRHETWFNALSYLLMRTADGEQEQAGEDEISNEFNAGYSVRSTSRQTGRSRTSRTSSFVNTQQTSSSAFTGHPTLRPSAAPIQHAQSSEADQDPASGRLSSLSGRFTSSFRGSFSSRRSRISAQEATVQQPGERDSRMELSQELAEQRLRDSSHLDGMENVRACCDGKHTVDGLHHHSHKGRHNSYRKDTRASLTASLRSSRSQSRTSNRNDQIKHENDLQAANGGAGY